MKNIILAILPIIFSSIAVSQNSIYDYKVVTIDGDTISMSQFKGKKVMIVNTASKCGFTKQYKDLQELYLKYKDQNFIIIGFPENNFLYQEPGSNSEIKEFCTKNYGVSFPMMAKISVKGKDIHPLYSWLTKKELNGVQDSKIEWNFQKYLIDENGKIIKVISPKVNPLDDEIQNWIKG
ncbi:MAG: glutathione peroxidase [Bacteroidota bacterium]